MGRGHPQKSNVFICLFVSSHAGMCPYLREGVEEHDIDIEPKS